MSEAGLPGTDSRPIKRL